VDRYPDVEEVHVSRLWNKVRDLRDLQGRIYVVVAVVMPEIQKFFAVPGTK
jgi:hypothetical protein